MRHQQRTRRWGLLAASLIAGVLATQLVGVTPASAAPAPISYAQLAGVSTARATSAVAWCPVGQVAVSGGGGVAPQSDWELGGVVNRIRPVTRSTSQGRQYGFLVAARHLSVQPPQWNLLAFVSCTVRPPGYQIVSNTVTGSVDRYHPDVASNAFCGSGRKAIGTGGAVSARYDSPLLPVPALEQAKFRSDLSGTRATGYFRDIGTLRVTAYAICADLDVELFVERGPYNQDPVKTVSFQNCRADQHLYGAGAAVAREIVPYHTGYNFPPVKLWGFGVYAGAADLDMRYQWGDYRPWNWQPILQAVCVRA